MVKSLISGGDFGIYFRQKGRAIGAGETMLDALVGKIQKFIVLVLAGMLVVVVVLSTVHLGTLIAEQVWKHRERRNRYSECDIHTNQCKLQKCHCNRSSAGDAGRHRHYHYLTQFDRGLELCGHCHSSSGVQRDVLQADGRRHVNCQHWRGVYGNHQCRQWERELQADVQQYGDQEHHCQL